MYEIVTIGAADTAPLRRSVLRDGTPSDVVEFDGDELVTTFHLGARLDGEIVAVSSWFERPHVDHPGLAGRQLRGMATDPMHRGTGVSEQLLTAGVQRCRERGARLVWARARVAALSFYVRHGFEPIGIEYVDETTRIPHRDIIRFLD